MPRTHKTPAPHTSEPTPQRRVVSYPPSTWLARITQELIGAGIAHDSAGLIARRVITALTPSAARLEAMDHRGDRYRIDAEKI